ncbi:hypothetical protein NQ317_006591 [Molorchus minor]|uniref:Protein sleepless n=1 Tax=Molorchus minor TaxID=1323400 RepID=A0ABQ9K0C2_9CUCU|nr:hypothetical protein NQ317_006591 [Molorchus minor]
MSVAYDENITSTMFIRHPVSPLGGKIEQKFKKGYVMNSFEDSSDEVWHLQMGTPCKAVRCFQCSSDEDGPDKDNCGAYTKFDKRSNIAIDCSSDESHMPGDGRWRQVIRRCASVAETGVTGVCNWGVYENGIYWEECYCSEDECNGANLKGVSILAMMVTGILLVQQFL